MGKQTYNLNDKSYSANPSDKKTAKEDMDRMMKEFLAKGGKVQKIPAGERTPDGKLKKKERR
tara:strand:- start:368 stop:553 length:186 start_codon:yes stop_codon:yes gene_type:complete